MSDIGIKEKLLEWKASGLGLIDLRSTELFEKFHVAGGTNIPAKKIPELGEQNFNFFYRYLELFDNVFVDITSLRVIVNQPINIYVLYSA
jgi:rhodanese-related sulfurtransferase